jgi:hypothetical protein
MAGAANLDKRLFTAIGDLVGQLGGRAIRHAERLPADDPTRAPLSIPNRNIDSLVRACWPLGLATEVYRSGVQPASPLIHYLNTNHDPTVEGLLALADLSTVQEMSALVELAQQELLPSLAEVPPPWFLGPIFTGSQWMKGDADLIVGNILIELKTNLGAKRGDTRVPELSMKTLRQVIGYLLHDVNDTYHLTKVGIYEARYGTLITWPIDEFLEQLAGHVVDLASIRAEHRRILIAR